MNGLKAYYTFIDNPMDGCVIVFAHNATQAKAHGCKAGPWSNEDYLDIRARRAPELDEYAEGDAPYCVETNDELPEGVNWYTIEI